MEGEREQKDTQELTASYNEADKPYQRGPLRKWSSSLALSHFMRHFTRAASRNQLLRLSIGHRLGLAERAECQESKGAWPGACQGSGTCSRRLIAAHLQTCLRPEHAFKMSGRPLSQSQRRVPERKTIPDRGL